MGRIKHTKNELKAQREALQRFERFLPMLQLKKEQLQAEIHAIDARLTDANRDVETIWGGFVKWVALLSEPIDLSELVSVERVITDEGNIAGVAIPVLKSVDIRRGTPDLFATPAWTDDAADVLDRLMRLHAEMRVLEEQRRLIIEELRTTSQRLNLFEKVKIPECREHIRVIRIFLGDQQTAAVVRGKIAKRRLRANEEEGQAA